MDTTLSHRRRREARPALEMALPGGEARGAPGLPAAFSNTAWTGQMRDCGAQG